MRETRFGVAWSISKRRWVFADCRGGALPPPGFQGLMKAAIESVGAGLCVGPWAGHAKRGRADT